MVGETPDLLGLSSVVTFYTPEHELGTIKWLDCGLGGTTRGLRVQHDMEAVRRVGGKEESILWRADPSLVSVVVIVRGHQLDTSTEGVVLVHDMKAVDNPALGPKAGLVHNADFLVRQAQHGENTRVQFF